VTRRAAAASAFAVAAMAAAAPAQAATLFGDQACYQELETMTVTATGFTPNGVVNFSQDNLAFGTPTADAAGNLRAVGPAPRLGATTQRRSLLEARDATNPSIFASINPLVTKFSIRVNPQGGRPSRVRRIRARGFTEGRTLYAHVRRNGRGKNFRLGRLKGPCGVKSVRKRLFRARAKIGVYRVQFDTRRRYSTRVSQRKVFAVTIRRVFKSGGASTSAFAERWTPVR